MLYYKNHSRKYNLPEKKFIDRYLKSGDFPPTSTASSALTRIVINKGLCTKNIALPNILVTYICMTRPPWTLAKKFCEESGSTVLDTRPPILWWPAIPWPDHLWWSELGHGEPEPGHHGLPHQPQEIRQLLDMLARAWGAGGQASLHLHTLDGRARALLDLQLGHPVAPHPEAPNVRGDGPG